MKGEINPTLPQALGLERACAVLIIRAVDPNDICIQHRIINRYSPSQSCNCLRSKRQCLRVTRWFLRLPVCRECEKDDTEDRYKTIHNRPQEPLNWWRLRLKWPENRQTVDITSAQKSKLVNHSQKADTRTFFRWNFEGTRSSVRIACLSPPQQSREKASVYTANMRAIRTLEPYFVRHFRGNRKEGLTEQRIRRSN